MTDEEKDKVIYEVLALHAGNGLKDCPVSHLAPRDVWKWINKMNEALSNTPFMYMLFADAGIQVVLKEQAVAMGKTMFDKPMEGYIP